MKTDEAPRPAESVAVEVGSPMVFGPRTSAWEGHGVRRTWAGPSAGADLADEILAGLAEHGDGPGAIALGALSFRPDAPALFVQPELVARRPVTVPVTGAPSRTLTRSDVLGAAGYEERVRAVLARMALEPDLHKVVLGRWLELAADPPWTSTDIVEGLAANAGLARLFAVPDPTRADRMLVGASPELLVSRRGRSVRSLPLAGSVARSEDPDTDAARGRELLESAKDLVEHRYVVTAIDAALRPLCSELVVSSPDLIRTDTMWHLATRVSGWLDPSRGAPPSALHLAQLLHPTPAVCGTPEARARQLIDELEEDRGAMTGAVGWTDAGGDGTFAVTIRAGLLDQGRLSLFAGAGIIRGSDPVREGLETEAKLQTMLRGVGQ